MHLVRLLPRDAEPQRNAQGVGRRDCGGMKDRPAAAQHVNLAVDRLDGVGQDQKLDFHGYSPRHVLGMPLRLVAQDIPSTRGRDAYEPRMRLEEWAVARGTCGGEGVCSTVVKRLCEARHAFSSVTPFPVLLRGPAAIHLQGQEHTHATANKDRTGGGRG